MFFLSSPGGGPKLIRATVNARLWKLEAMLSGAVGNNLADKTGFNDVHLHTSVRTDPPGI
jgi:hypothetical protein